MFNMVLYNKQITTDYLFSYETFKDDRGSFDSQAKSTYYARTSSGVYPFSDDMVQNNVTAAKSIKDSVYQYLC